MRADFRSQATLTIQNSLEKVIKMFESAVKELSLLKLPTENER